MKKMNVFSYQGISEEDNNSIMETIKNAIEMTIDEYGRVFTEGGIYIADAVEVEAGCGAGC